MPSLYSQNLTETRKMKTRFRQPLTEPRQTRRRRKNLDWYTTYKLDCYPWSVSDRNGRPTVAVVGSVPRIQIQHVSGFIHKLRSLIMASSGGCRGEGLPHVDNLSPDFKEKHPLLRIS